MYPQERSILKMLARGQTAAQICEKLEITRASFHTHCHQIRAKTGIPDTHDAKACRDWITGQGENMNIWGTKLTRDKRGPTQAQLRMMLLYAQGKTVEQIALTQHMAKSTVGNHLSSGCMRAGVKRSQVHIYMREKGLFKSNVEDPMQDPAFS